MKWFGKGEAIFPEVVHGLIVAAYSPREECWTFKYQDIEYLSWGHRLNLPDESELEAIHNDVLILMPEMKERISLGWQGQEEAVVDDGEEYFVNITEFRLQDEFGVCWSGGASWGDMGVEFTLHNRRIVGEEWGD